jgi:hypothetical protein
MSIDLHWEDERGEMLGEVSDPHNLVVHLVAVADPKESRCLLFLDPYGDTTFNQIQIPVFEEEVRSLPSESLSEEAEGHRTKILEMVASARGRDHSYLKFYGD